MYPLPSKVLLFCCINSFPFSASTALPAITDIRLCPLSVEGGLFAFSLTALSTPRELKSRRQIQINLLSYCRQLMLRLKPRAADYRLLICVHFTSQLQSAFRPFPAHQYPLLILRLKLPLLNCFEKHSLLLSVRNSLLASTSALTASNLTSRLGLSVPC